MTNGERRKRRPARGGRQQEAERNRSRAAASVSSMFLGAGQSVAVGACCMMGSVLFSRRWMNQRLSLNQKGLHKAMLVLEVLVSVCSLSIIDQSRLSGLWLTHGNMLSLGNHKLWSDGDLAFYWLF